MSNLEESMKRGQLVEDSLEKSARLSETSVAYKKTAKKTKQTFCARRYKMYALAAFIIIAIIATIVLFIKL